MSKELDKEFNIAGYQRLLLDFMDEKIVNFYLDFAKRSGSYHVLTEALYKITVAASPILMYTSQEAHYHLQ